jgi:Ser-tRNA(Ala) deacylase AlaX
MDINCSLGRISNKSAKYSNNKKSIDISSYRLTTVCSEKKCGTPTEIIEEINKRKNFDYYSFIVRDETDKKSDELHMNSLKKIVYVFQ